MTDLPLDPVAIDVGSLLRGSVTSLYAQLVTRQTGRAVRLAIETQIAEAAPRALSLVDLSEVSILDYSCADEVVAKLLQRFADDARVEAFFVFRGVDAPHREQVETVLRRQGLAVVAETEAGRYELLGGVDDPLRAAWNTLEERGRLAADEAAEAGCETRHLDELVRARLAFRSPITGRYHALSRIVAHLHPRS